MANHLTPEELSRELGMERQEVIKVCIEEGVPIYQGKIDKTLFRSASIRSSTGASATGSGAAISSPASLASSIARRSRR